MMLRTRPLHRYFEVLKLRFKSCHVERWLRGICIMQVVGTKKKLQKMRDSVLTRSSVRLSVIPQDIINKLRRKPVVR